MMMKAKSESDDAAVFEAAVEAAKRRCRGVRERIESLSSSNVSCNCKTTLLRLVNSELSFLSRFSLSSHSNPRSNSTPPINLSFNIGHLEAVVYILQQPFVTGVSRVCKPIPPSPSVKTGQKTAAFSKGVHVDIVCTLNGNPLWFVVSDRNPKYIFWHNSHGNKGLRMRIEQLLDVAQSSVTLKPSSIILFFSHGLDECLCEKLRDEFGATNFEMEFSCFDCAFSEVLEGEWIDLLARSYQQASILEIKVDCSWNSIPRVECGVKDSLLGAAGPDLSMVHVGLDQGGSFCSLISGFHLCSLDVKGAELILPNDLSGKANLINFDATALIAIVSGISNGATDKLLATSEGELRSRFKGNYEFVIAQAISEIQNPIHLELGGVISGKGGIICESVCSEFKELVSMCGGLNEKLRAEQLLKHLMVVPDCPSARMMSLPTTRKLALKNKVVFGTGDYWHAPTLTANMAFLRAISQTGMPLFTLEHRPRALTGD